MTVSCGSNQKGYLLLIGSSRIDSVIQLNHSGPRLFASFLLPFLKILAFPSLAYYLMVVGQLLHLHLHCTFYSIFPNKKEGTERGRSLFLAKLVFLFCFFPGKGNFPAYFSLKPHCLELVHMSILKPITGSREWDYYDCFRPILVHSFGLEKR